MAKENYIDAIRDFMKEVKRTFARGIATEHTYRPVLKILLDKLGAGKIYAVNEPKRIACGSPDIALMRKDIAIGYLEAKDIGEPIRKFKNLANKTQFDNYTKYLDNLIYTDCLNWDFYRNGKRVYSVSVAEIRAGVIVPNSDNFAELSKLLQNFLNQPPQTIRDAEELTKYMAKRTKMLRYSFAKSMEEDDNEPLEALIKQHTLIDKMLVKDITVEDFTDIYAQTITYGMFVARLYSKTPETFSRQEAQRLLPTTYPFLRKLFIFIASDELENKLDQPIDDLINLYRIADVETIMATYQKSSGRTDPFLHFYENFLKAYNPLERKRSGVYYTPESVVDFIVRGVDWVLKDKLNLRNGLANSEKADVMWKTNRVEGEDYQEELREVHKVQILDPATGTGTFLAQTIRHIAKSVKKSAPAGWSSYVDKDLLPRLHGFEFMMAPYAMSYLKLDMVLDNLGYKPTKPNPDRMSIYLTNSLTETTTADPNLAFLDWLEEEAEGANNIKDNFPIMCVIGNPPYSGVSQNMGDSATWINGLIEDYKYIKDEHFNEQKHWLHNDYVKFIRMAEHMVDKTGEGVVGMITDHSYIKSPTFRGMRWHLMNSFDGIYILDLHGSADEKKFELKGKNDKNVFDIREGVSIIIAWRKKWTNIKDKPLAQVFRGDLWGPRQQKFDSLDKKGKALSTESLETGLFQELDVRKPDYFFKPVNYELKAKYDKGFKITDFMRNNVTSIVTMGDDFIITYEKSVLQKRLKNFLSSNKTKDDLEKDLKENFKLGKNYPKWIAENKNEIEFDAKNLVEINYRPFDTRWTYFDNKVIWRWRKEIMNQFLAGNTLGLVAKRGFPQEHAAPVFCTNIISDFRYWSSSGMQGGDYLFPLYTYPETTDEDGQIKMQLDTARVVNMDKTIRKAIEDIATDSKHGKPDEYAIFDYIYGILHAPSYRKLYSEFLKEDFPRVPYPKDSAEFWYLSSIGTKLRELHLMPKDINISAYTFGGEDTTPIVEKPHFDDGKVLINKTQYFDNVPESAWEAHIGGYQPAQRWLKDHKGQKIDITHYQKIIAVLVQTEQTMQTIKWSRP